MPLRCCTWIPTSVSSAQGQGKGHCTQVASALKYIHDREIVYCDLKSDNVLVWSLDPRVPINVKISDYGISQFSSPQGVLSTDGTPGFQAPEVRPGMVYDFKVDIFSNAMLLYELSTGLRPLAQYSSGLEIAQSLREGVRPSLSDHNISINFPCLEMLMRKCWVADPQRRPTVKDIIDQLKKITFISQQRVIEMNSQLVSSMLSMQTQDSRDTVGVWGGEGGRRTYSVVDVEQEVFRIDQKKLPGSNVFCMAGVGGNIWAGTGAGEIEVYGHRRAVGLQDHLWTIRCAPGNQVLSLLTYQVEEVENLSSVKQRKKRQYQHVYVGLDNGTVRLYRRAIPDNVDQGDDTISRTESMVVTQEESEWEEVKEIVLGDNPEERVTCMALVNNDKELWVGCGGTIVIIGTTTKLKEHRVELFRDSVIQIRCHENRVWCFERGSAKVLELDPSSHQQVRELSCEGDQVTVGSILVVKDTLWVGTSTGDVQVFNINPDSPHYDIGQLLTTLKTEPPEQGCDFGSIRHMTAVGGNKVVYARDQIRNADGRMWYQMVTWGAMGTDDIHRVQSFWNKLRQVKCSNLELIRYTTGLTKFCTKMSVLYSLAARLFAYCDVQTALVLVSVLLLTFWYLRLKKNLPPGPWGWPVLGHIPALGKNPHLGLTAMRKRYGDVFHIRMGPKDVVVLCGYEAIHEALVKKGEDFSSRPYLYIFDKMGSFENGLGFLPYGSFWKQQRKFTLRSLRDFGFGKRSLEGKILEEAEGLKEEILQTANAPFNARPLLQNAVSNVICSIVFGSRFEYSDPKFQYLMERINQNFGEQELAGPANFFPWLRHIPAVKKAVDKVVKNAKDVIGTLREFLIEHKNTFDPSNIRDFIDSYLLEMDQEDEAGSRESFTEDQLNYVISDLFVAGSETTSTTLSWALLYMVLYPEVQQKVQQEIDSVVRRDTVLSIIHRSQLPYTEAVITEIMRIKPVAPLGLPRATSNDTNLFGYDIPEGTMVWPVLWSVLYDPVHYPEPDVFKPHRFLNENGQFVKDPTFIPFSTGRRICLGENLAKMELSLIFAHLLQHFTFKLPEGATKPTTVGIMGIITYSPVSYELCAIPRE
ncbi:CYP2J2 [Branchiostoma lanceolatum]|uniref:Cytochrome P450 2U1 n=1 Tax=Branchiostoma lanceolatum TaxID=7740 RepID=A0A8J9ZIV0_BRALA|nr:CYP2J2 [Branchiostoma lanceolatum]